MCVCVLWGLSEVLGEVRWVERVGEEAEGLHRAVT